MKQASDLKRHQLEEITNALITELFWDEDAKNWRLNKEVNGADFVEHMTTVLVKHGVEPATKPNMDRIISQLKGASFDAKQDQRDLDMIRIVQPADCPDIFVAIDNFGFTVRAADYKPRRISDWDFDALCSVLSDLGQPQWGMK